MTCLFAIDTRLTQRGPALAAALAAVAAAPSIGLPFISDDWMHTLFASQDTILRTPFNFFRPLCSLTYWVDWQLWGFTPAPFHLTNVVLASATAALVVVLIRRYTGDAVLATLAGVVFALHPYHIGAIAWISARSDLLSAMLLLLAAWAYDRWRERSAGLPILAMILYEAAMLAKEGAVVLGAFLVLVGLFDPRRRARLGEWMRGYLPMLAVALLHFVVVRSWSLGGEALYYHLKWVGAWRGNLLAYGLAGVTPPPTEVLQARPWLWGAVAAAVTAALAATALWRTRRIPPVIWPAAAAFVVLLGPSLIGFQQRYFFLPSAAAALALAALLRAAGARIGGAIAIVLLGGWLLTAVELWNGWFVAGRASHRLLNGLVEASTEAEVETLVVIGIPHRVHGVPVTTDYTRAVPFIGGREVTVRSATEFDFPSDRGDALDGPPESAIQRRADHVELSLSVVPRPYSRHVLPLFPAGETRVEKEGATVVREGRHAMRVKIEPRPGIRAYVWIEGELVPLDAG